MLHEILSPNLGMGFAFSVLVMIKRQVIFGVVLVISRLISQEIIYSSRRYIQGEEEGCWWQLAI